MERIDESSDDAGTDGGDASEDDSRRKLFQFEALQDAAQNAADNAQEVAMNVGGRVNETLQNVGGALNETVNRVNETVQGGLDRVNDFVEGIQGGGDDANATNATTNGTMMNDTMMSSTEDAGMDGEEASEDDSRRKLLDMHEAMMEEATDAMMNATMNGTMMNGTEEEHDHDHDHEGEDHEGEGEESSDDAGTDGGEASEDDSRRMLRKLAMA